MKFQSFTRRFLSGALALSLFTGAVMPAARADLWQTSKDYTASIAKGAAEVGAVTVAAAAAALKAAQADLARAQAALAAARAGGVLIIIGDAVGAVAAAEAAVAAAASAYAAAVLAAEAAAAILAGLALGTAIGQGINWLLSFCYDSSCDLTPIGEGFAYASASQAEIDGIIPGLIYIGTGQEMSVDQLDPETYALASQQVRIFLNLARGAAAYTEGMPNGVLAAVTDLKSDLASLPDNLFRFSEHIENTKLLVPQMEEIKVEFVGAIQEAQAVLNENRNKPGVDPEQVDLALEQLSEAYAAFIDADNKALEVLERPIVGPGGLTGNLTVKDYDQFLEDCATKGKACLPKSETEMVARLMEAAGVYSPSTPDFGVEIAHWDAFYGDNPQERAILESYGEVGVNTAELFRNSVTERSKEGTWMNIDLEKSPLTQWARAEQAKNNVDQPETGGGCSLSVANPVSTSVFGSLLLAVSGLIGGFGLLRRRKTRH
jgi:hypothetical protein